MDVVVTTRIILQELSVLEFDLYNYKLMADSQKVPDYFK